MLTTDATIIIVVSFALILGIPYLYRKISKNIKQHFPMTIFKTIIGLLSLAWIIIVVIIIAKDLSLEGSELGNALIDLLSTLTTTLTISGLFGLAVTLAFQSTFSNILSGFFLLQENVLRMGDIITYGIVKGEVVKITYRTVWIKKDNGEIAVISNSTLSNGPFTNHTATERLTKNLALSQKIGKKLQETADKIPLLND